MLNRTIKIFYKNYIVPVIEGSPEAKINTDNNYMEVVAFFQQFSETFYKDNVDKIFIECFEKDNIKIHFDFCRDVAIHYNTIVEFVAKEITYNVDKNTPDDWYDICSEEVNQLEDKTIPIGLTYIDLPIETIKENLNKYRQILTYTQNLILEQIRGDYDIDWRNTFTNYEAFKKWATYQYTIAFIYQRKLFHYSSVLKNKIEKENIENCNN